MNVLIKTAFGVALASAFATAQTASFSPFGNGCIVEGQQLRIGNQGLPIVGQSFTVTYSGPNYTGSSAQKIARPWFGFGDTSTITPIPANLFMGQRPGCTGYVGVTAMTPMPPSAAQPVFQNSITLAVPNNPNLIGLTFYGQWLLVVEQCGIAGCGYWELGTSDAASILVGT